MYFSGYIQNVNTSYEWKLMRSADSCSWQNVIKWVQIEMYMRLQLPMLFFWVNDHINLKYVYFRVSEDTALRFYGDAGVSDQKSQIFNKHSKAQKFQHQII